MFGNTTELNPSKIKVISIDYSLNTCSAYFGKDYVSLRVWSLLLKSQAISLGPEVLSQLSVQVFMFNLLSGIVSYNASWRQSTNWLRAAFLYAYFFTYFYVASYNVGLPKK
jgi:hypothetical protein